MAPLCDEVCIGRVHSRCCDDRVRHHYLPTYVYLQSRLPKVPRVGYTHSHYMPGGNESDGGLAYGVVLEDCDGLESLQRRQKCKFCFS